MIYLREFEIYEADGYVLADPIGMEGGTFGESFQDAVRSASDWLRETITDDLIHGRTPAGAMLGNEPKRGGRIVVVSVDCDLERVDAVTAAEAARMLNVSSARVAQMCESGKLTSWKRGSRRMVMRSSVQARIDEQPKAGRPRRNAIEA